MRPAISMTETDPPPTYAGAGVDVEAGRRAVELIRGSVASTARPEVVGGLGGFGGLFAFDPSRYRQPLLVSSTDGVGTKLLVAQALGRHGTVGIDLVAMSVDDVVAQGAEPLFFLDYIVIERLVPALVDEIVSGIAAGCREARCALVGGEMAEHPGHLAPGSYDLAGFCVGVVERDRLVTGAGITPGDAVIGLASVGVWIRFAVAYLEGNGKGHVQSLILGAVLFIAAVVLWALGVSGFDAILIAVVMVLAAIAIRNLLPFLPGRGA